MLFRSGLLATRGVTTATALASVISAHAVQAAPVNLAAMLATASLASAGTGTLTFWNIMNLTKLKLGIGALVVAAASTALVVQHQSRDKLLMANEALTQQIAQLKADNESLVSLAAQATKPALPPSDQLAELLRLRGEVGMLRQQTNELGRFRQENRRLLSQAAAQSESTNQVSAEDQFTLRQTHAVDAMTILLKAIKNYATNHNGQYPGDFDQLTASGDLGVSDFAGNLRLADFELKNDSAVDPHDGKIILSLRVPLQRPGGASVIVLGGIDDDGVTRTIIRNVSPHAAQASPAPPQ